MKILFWILAILSIPVGLFVSIVCYMSHGLGLTGTGLGEVVCIAGMLAAVICIVCMVLGIIKLRKGDVKKAIVFALAGVAYCGIIIAGIFIGIFRQVFHQSLFGEDAATYMQFPISSKIYPCSGDESVSLRILRR